MKVHFNDFIDADIFPIHFVFLFTSSNQSYFFLILFSHCWRWSKDEGKSETTINFIFKLKIFNVNTNSHLTQRAVLLLFLLLKGQNLMLQLALGSMLLISCFLFSWNIDKIRFMVAIFRRRKFSCNNSSEKGCFFYLFSFFV